MLESEQRYTWKAVGLNGHREKMGGDFLYTSDSAPIEADEYERQRQRAETAEAHAGKLELDRNKARRERDAAIKRAETAEAQLGKEVAVSLIHARENDVLSAALREQRIRAATAEARVKELESQLAGLIPAAQVVVTGIEFIPIPASNAAADSALLTGTGETSGDGSWKQGKSALLP